MISHNQTKKFSILKALNFSAKPIISYRLGSELCTDVEEGQILTAWSDFFVILY